MIGIKCDGCNKMHAANINMSYSDKVPDDWYSFYKGKPDRVEKVSHFCSLACLNTWLAPQLVGDEIASSSPPIVVHNYIQDEHWKVL